MDSVIWKLSVVAVAATLDSVITEKGTTLKIDLCRDIISGKLESFFV